MLLGLIGTSPAIVTKEHKLRDLVSYGGADHDEMAHGLSVAQMPKLRTIYNHADEMPRDPDLGVPGDGEVPLDNIKRVISTLINFHHPSESQNVARRSKTRTSIFRHENEAFSLLFGDVAQGDKEKSKLLMATTLLFDSDSSGSTQFVEFTLGISNLRRNPAQLALFNISIRQLDKNITAYSDMLESLIDIRDNPSVSHSLSACAVPALYSAPLMLIFSVDSLCLQDLMLKQQYKRISVNPRSENWNSKLHTLQAQVQGPSVACGYCC